ncbi:Stp1/IreP family PP2C-type Ser/Thr phosphatase [Candidatus Margulisiibacteriota bacterium]
MADPKGIFKIVCGAKTDKGLIRDLNEDHLIAREVSGRHDVRGIYAVADGMGGHNAGEIASQMAIDTFGGLAHSAPGFASNGYKYVLEETVAMANKQVFTEAHSDASKKGMGTTFTGVLVEQNNIHIAHVGDSRAYILRAGRMQMITEEHSYVAELLKKGKITKDEAKGHTDSNVITRAIGLKDTVQPDVKSLKLQDGDVMILCSDGLTDLVLEHEIQKVVETSKDPQAAADELVRAANMRGGDDNITVIVIYVGNKKTVGIKRKIFSRSMVIAGILFILAAIGFMGLENIKDRFSMVGVPGNMGKISVASYFPGSVAYVNGIWIGKTPVRDVLFDVGTHKLEVRYAGFNPYVKKIVIKGKQKLEVQAKFFGTLSLATRPLGATVVINNRKLRKTTPITVKLEAGRTHTIKVLKKDCVSKTVRRRFFKSAAKERVNITLQQLGHIQIASYKIKDVKAYLNNKPVNLKFKDGQALLKRIPIGSHIVKMKTSDGKIDQLSVKVVPGKTSNLTFTFGLKTKESPTVAGSSGKKKSDSERIQGTILMVSVNQPDFYYSITGEGIDTMPKLVKGKVLRQTGFPAGRYYLTISKEGFEDVEREIIIKDGKEIKLMIEMVE